MSMPKSSCVRTCEGKNNKLLDALPFSKVVGRMVEMIAYGVEADTNLRDDPTPENRRRVMMTQAQVGFIDVHRLL